VSVLVPARNEAESLPALVEALLRQTRPADEILIADAGSTDRTADVAREASPRARVIDAGPGFPGATRNRAARAASHDWLAFVDAGCRPGPGWLARLTEAAATGSLAVFGSYAPRLETEWDWAQALAFVAAPDEEGWRGPSTASLLLHRSALEAAGWFPEELRAAEDHVFFGRLAASGIPTTREPRAVVEWSLQPSPRAAFRRLRLYSRHHAAAGLWGTWHRRVLAMDVVAMALAAVMPVWPLAGALLGVGAIARLLRTVARRRRNVPGSAFRPDRLVRVAWLLVLGDVAAWLGLLDHFHSGRAASQSSEGEAN
jgi:glycosyltransferase involved in cell wall biosynthesis